jgi:septum formation protein
MPQGITLASGSPTRSKLLLQCGVCFETIIPRIDEQSLKDAAIVEGISAYDIADLLAEQKAMKVSKKQNGFVIGSDQVLELDGQLWSKPTSEQELADQIRAFRGKTHRLHTAAVIVEDQNPVWRKTLSVDLTMTMVSDTYLSSYVRRNYQDVKDCVGGYKIEGEGVRLFSEIRGDYFAILGLPLLEILDFLALRGAIAS